MAKATATRRKASSPSSKAASTRKPRSKSGGVAKTVNPESAQQTFAELQAAHPDAHCELDHDSPFQLIVATVLSAQSTDVAVNQVTPGLFAAWPTVDALAKAPVEAVEGALNRLGMFRQKAKNITGLARKLRDEHGGEVPHTLDALVQLPGVGRKTANVVLGVCFGTPEGVVVDTHVQRISQRLGWTRQETPEKIERDLMALFPRPSWDALSHTLIFHGRRVCAARKPACAACSVAQRCPSAFDAESVGRKPKRVRASTTLEAAVSKSSSVGKPARRKTAKKSRPSKKTSPRSPAS